MAGMGEMPRSSEVITFGCRLNACESDRIENLIAAAGLQDTVVVNSCAVTAEAERQVRQAIRRVRRARPGARILATGCAAQIHPQEFLDMPEVDGVIPNAAKVLAGTWQAVAGGALPGVVERPVRPRRARAYVEVQNGCDHRCTFCVIPQGRGDSRSVPTEQVVSEVAEQAAAGFAEVVLTGVDLTSWGTDLPGRPVLGDLVAAVMAGVPELPRLRLSSIDAAEIDPLLETLFAGEPRLMPHLHLSLQAGDDMILKRMKRRHSRVDAVRLCTRLAARRRIAIGADLIAGFPTETEAMFRNTCRLVEECGISYLHVFPFSPRPGTPAARMPPVPRDTVRRRARQLREIGRQRLDRHLESLVGAWHSTLVETSERGRTECYAPVCYRRPREREEIGRTVRVRGTGVEEGVLQAE